MFYKINKDFVDKNTLLEYVVPDLNQEARTVLPTPMYEKLHV